MLVLWMYEIRDTVFWAVTGGLDIALLLWLHRTSARSDVDHVCRDRRPSADSRPSPYDDLLESGAEQPGASQDTAVNQPERSSR